MDSLNGYLFVPFAKNDRNRRLSTQTELKRSLSLWLVTFYGLGTIIGAGIYVLIGEVAAVAGYAAPLAFVLAAALAGLSAFSYAELAARMPLSAGEAIYVQAAFGWPGLSRLIALLVVMIAVVSSATLANGFAGYLQVFISLPHPFIVVLLLGGIAVLACWGITESALGAALTTLIEIGGLLLILWVSRGYWVQLPAILPQILPGAETCAWVGVIGAAFVAFYAFIGFEDIVNLAEEVQAPERNLPVAILLSLAIACVLYLLVAVAAVLVVRPEILGVQQAPLVYVYQQASGGPAHFIGLISMAAIFNGVLIQVIKASRILYGSARQGWLPAWLGDIHPRRRTPIYGTLLVAAIIVCFALWLPLVTLAKLTSLLTLLVFCMVNLALWCLKRHAPAPEGIRVYPPWVPLLGLFASVAFLFAQLLDYL